MDPDCEFCKIVSGGLPAHIVGDSSGALAFFPLMPVCIGHALVIPKTHVADLWSSANVPDQGVMELVFRVGQAIKQVLEPDGLNLISSAGQAASQTVFHLHLHIIPRWTGDRLGNIWPPAEPLSGERKSETASKIYSAYRAISRERQQELFRL